MKEFLLTQSGTTTTTLGQSGPEAMAMKEHSTFPKLQGWASLSDCLISYPGCTLWGSYPSAEMHLVYSTAPNDWAELFINIYSYFRFNFTCPVPEILYLWKCTNMKKYKVFRGGFYSFNYLLTLNILFFLLIYFYLNLPRGIWIFRWNEKRKSFKHSIFVSGVFFVFF